MIAVSELIELLREAGALTGVSGPLNKNINAVTNDSRSVGPDDLFIAIRGEQSDGHLFIDKAVKNGAIAIVHEVASEEMLFKPSSDVTLMHVANGRIAEAVLAARMFGHPAEKLELIGATGTNGKTSTIYLTQNLLEHTGTRTGIIGTVESSTGVRTYISDQTTPGPLRLHSLLSEMIEDGCSACAMEVSSHAIEQERVYGLNFAAAAFTNLTQDHLDYHHTFDDYFKSKKKLFDGLGESACAVTNIDDSHGMKIVADTAATIVTFGSDRRADVQFEIVSQKFDGLEIRINGRLGHFKLIGQFNAYNLACAYAIATATGRKESEVFEYLQNAPRIPGRFEPIWTVDDKLVVIDYAHTPDALEKALQTIRLMNTRGGAVWCVFGCGGDRDKTKRPLMGRIAERNSDNVIVTSDNPRTEDPYAIMQDIVAGIETVSKVETIVDRRKAIEHAAANSSAGDIILIAGKGHEKYQIVGTERLHCDDPEIVQSSFNVAT